MKLYALTKSLNSRKVLALIHHLDLPVEIDAMTVEQVQSAARKWIRATGRVQVTYRRQESAPESGAQE